MTEEWKIIWESDFKIIDEKELEKIKKSWKEIKELEEWWNLRDDLIELWFLEYDKLSEEEKIIFDEMKKEKRDDDFYEL